MKIFVFKATDPNGNYDYGPEMIIVRASRYSIAKRYVTDEQKRLGRTDLHFELVETLGNKAIIYSNMEANNATPNNA